MKTEKEKIEGLLGYVLVIAVFYVALVFNKAQLDVGFIPLLVFVLVLVINLLVGVYLW